MEVFPFCVDDISKRNVLQATAYYKSSGKYQEVIEIILLLCN